MPSAMKMLRTSNKSRRFAARYLFSCLLVCQRRMKSYWKLTRCESRILATHSYLNFKAPIGRLLPGTRGPSQA